VARCVRAAARWPDWHTYSTRIGVAYENQDGSRNLRFDYLPADLNGTTVQLRDFPAPTDGSPIEDEERGIGAQP
jgi:hypothetical protein